MKIKTKLKDYQKETVEWMRKRESKGKGGMILLEAGLGKTLTCLSGMKEGRTLIVSPAGVMNVWIEEIKKHTEGAKYYRYYGKDREPNKEDKIIITTYGTLIKRMEYNKKKEIFEIKGELREKYDRIILDEGHYIRNRDTKAAKAVLLLKGRYKWILTATPIFNEVNDAYVYFRFTELEGIETMREWKERVNKRREGIEELKRMFERNSKRYKKEDVLELKEKRDIEVELEFSKEEKEIYEVIKNYSINRIESLAKRYKVSKGIIKKRLGVIILVMILRLKQCSTSPYLAMIGMKRLRKEGITDRKECIRRLKYYTESKENKEECPVCMDMEGELIAKCGHKCCRKCWEAIMDTSAKCPVCREEIDEEELEEIEEDKKKSKQEKGKMKDLESTKTKWIVEKVRRLLEEKEKVIIVSQWTQTLTLIQKIIQKRLKVKEDEEIYLKGGITADKKSEMIEEFQKNKEKKICYLSMLGSAEGITLTASNKMIMVDKWWNKGKEEQVKERIYRIGQEREVTIYNLEMKESLEKKIQALGEKKEKIAKMVLGEVNIQTEESEEWIKKVIKILE